ncbi:MAG: (deoxy)nucleoside triphosphate pyrophosphohydrolase [Bacteroidales bacterium]|nr:(deoxy)nucleoside triphosphate pyrophosphohydrolase [Bacteroidales bacterium]
MLHVVCAVIEADGKILCLQKGINKYAYIEHHWEFPGGKVEAGESEEDALRRELLEEMDCPILIERHLMTTEHTYPDFSIRLSAYLCHIQPINPMHPDLSYPNTFILHEHPQHLWLSPKELHTLPWAAADNALIQLISTQL